MYALTYEEKQSIDWLQYKSYEHNRLRNPHIQYQKWRNLYKDALCYEEIFDTNFKVIQQEGAWGYVANTQ